MSSGLWESDATQTYQTIWQYVNSGNVTVHCKFRVWGSLLQFFRDSVAHATIACQTSVLIARAKVTWVNLRNICLLKWTIWHDVSKSPWLHFQMINVTVKFKFKIKWLFTSSANELVRALNCSKQILSRELSPIVCSTSVPSHGWKAFRGLGSQAFPGISLKRRTASEARGLKFRGNLSHVH